jgi:RHS repeat-associated protein
LPGQYHDRETNLYYNRHRYYDPKIGAYINQDPIGLDGGLNLSAYARNPLRFIDPLGLKQCKGTARVFQGNKDLIGTCGGFDTGPSQPDKYKVTKDSTAAIPSQYGLTKATMRPYIDQISGTLDDGTTFSGVRDVFDDADYRKAHKLASTAQYQQTVITREEAKSGQDLLILELPGADKDLGVQGVTLTVPDDLQCPHGTSEIKYLT